MVYVTTDIHGNLSAYRSILEQICLRPEDRLYVLGDVMDRFPHGIRILRDLMARPNARVLLGNHELMMMEYLDNPNAKTEFQWFRNGGEVTLRAYEACDRETRSEILRFLRSLPLREELTVNGRPFLLVHAAPLEWMDRYNAKNYGPVTFCVWYRLKGDEPVPGGRTMVFGHTPTCYYQDQRPMGVCQMGDLIGLDCGIADEDGRLACLRLDDGAVFYSKEKD